MYRAVVLVSAAIAKTPGLSGLRVAVLVETSPRRRALERLELPLSTACEYWPPGVGRFQVIVAKPAGFATIAGRKWGCWCASIEHVSGTVVDLVLDCAGALPGGS
jgi:hypothetical protein